MTFVRFLLFVLALAGVSTAVLGVAAVDPGVPALGGLRGDTFVAHDDDDVFEYSEFVTLDFHDRVDMTSFRSHVAISPATSFGAYGLDYGRRVRLNVRKVPGVTYTLSLSPGLAFEDGRLLGRAVTYRIRTAPEPAIPHPLRAVPADDAYRYGALEHPSRNSLAGQNAERIIGLLADAGIRFVRIDYCAGAILGDDDALTEPNFRGQDRILDQLAARGITEMPILDQYCAPKWAAGGKTYPAIFADPNAYARFAGLVAAHLAARYPQVRRIELFNEPNIRYWWSYPGDDAGLANRSGSGAARYMIAAYAAIKAAAPGMTVVGPALSDGGADTDPRRFLEQLYASGCGRGRCWDLLSVHNYSWMNPTFAVGPERPDRFDIYKDLQRIAAEHGDAGTHVMLTEWGYSHADRLNGFDPRVQAEYIALGFNRMLADPTVDGIVYVNVYNGGKPNFWSATQVVDDDFTLLPGYRVLREFAKR